MTSAPDRVLAADLVTQALAAVFDPAAVAVLREDSPLQAVGLQAADMVCVADAVALRAQARGQECVLTDADLVDVLTVADLVGVVATRLAWTEAS